MTTLPMDRYDDLLNSGLGDYWEEYRELAEQWFDCNDELCERLCDHYFELLRYGWDEAAEDEIESQPWPLERVLDSALRMGYMLGKYDEIMSRQAADLDSVEHLN